MNKKINNNISLNEMSDSVISQEQKKVFIDLILKYLIKEIEKIENEEGKKSAR
mgnify:CR=1 FL=1